MQVWNYVRMNKWDFFVVVFLVQFRFLFVCLIFSNVSMCFLSFYLFILL